MNIIINLFKIFFESFLFTFAVAIIISYVILSILSILALIKYSRRTKFVDYNAVLKSPLAPSISIIAPAFNEEKSISDNIHSLLSFSYTNFEVIIVNDGSTDKSLEIITKEFELVKVDFAYNEILETQKVNGIYRSANKAYSKLIVVDKENGGKSDALNAAINVSTKDYFLTIDVDCVLERDALLKMAKPFMEDDSVIASGGVVRVVNSCIVKNGNLQEVVVPKKILAKFQVLEYFRAFVLARMAWSRLNGLLLISGAFGMFDKKIALKCGGYDINTVGEDMELVVKMRRYMHDEKSGKYRVAFIPDPLCWTEVPETVRSLGRQRNRWTRGTIETLLLHRKMFLNPKYGRLGVISFPYWLLFEWMAPFVEFFGILYFLILLIIGSVNLSFFLLILLFVYTFAIFFSMTSVFFEELFFHQYKKRSDAFKLILVALIEPFVFHPLVVFYAIKGNFDFFIRKRHGWGKMKRVGFTKRYETE